MDLKTVIFIVIFSPLFLVSYMLLLLIDIILIIPVFIGNQLGIIYGEYFSFIKKDFKGGDL